MTAICFGIYLSFTMSSMLCVHGLRVLHNKHFESTLLSSNIPILFELCDPQCVHSIQYGTTLHFNTGKDQKDNAWVVGHARLIWIPRELRKLRKQVAVISSLIALSPDVAFILLKNATPYRITDHWWLDRTVKDLIAFRSKTPASLTTPASCGVQKKVICGSSSEWVNRINGGHTSHVSNLKNMHRKW